MRIIAGKYRGRRFDVPRSFKARPTTDFAKENLFNVIRRYIDLNGASALDLFSGTGSITLEMLSRGCRRVVSVESDRLHHAFILSCLKKLGDYSAIAVRDDVFRFLASQKGDSYDFIFADPPYTLPGLRRLPRLILSTGILREDGLLVLEHGKDNDFSLLPEIIDHRQYGSVNFSLFRTTARADASATHTDEGEKSGFSSSRSR